MEQEMSYWTAKANLDGAYKQRDAIARERSLLRKNRDLAKAERAYIWDRLTEQLVELIAVCNEYSRIVGRYEIDGRPNPFSLSGYRGGAYRYA